MSLEQEALRGKLAQDVLTNEVYVEAFASVEQGIIRTWRDAKSQDDRERLHLMLGLLSKVREAMEGTMRNGELATEKLRAEKTRLQRLGLAR